MKHSPRSLDPKTLAKIKGLQLRARQIVEGLLSGVHRSPYRGFSIEFSEHREYVPGDDLRHIDWKAVARTDKFYLKQFEDETNLICYIIVDASESMSFEGPMLQPRTNRLGSRQPGQESSPALNKLEYAKCLAASLAWLVLQQQDSVGVAVYSDQIRSLVQPSGHAGQLQQVLTALETAEATGKTQSGPALRHLAERFSKRGIVFVISDMFDDLEATLAGLQQLRQQRHHVSVLQTLDAAEIDFPYDRSMLFRGLEGGKAQRADSRTIRAAYLRELDRFQRRLQAACQKSGVRHHLVRTDHPLDQVLGKILTSH